MTCPFGDDYLTRPLNLCSSNWGAKSVGDRSKDGEPKALGKSQKRNTDICEDGHGAMRGLQLFDPVPRHLPSGMSGSPLFDLSLWQRSLTCPFGNDLELFSNWGAKSAGEKSE
jgi:hypothetical protein